MGVRGVFDRPSAVARLAADPFDVLVIGGGVTGTGVAVDAASRGLRTALVERHDFGSGTSSRSSKLIHGGLRYLQGRDVRLVYDALAERTRLARNAPHLVSVMPFLVPLFTRDGVVDRRVARGLGAALWMYDLTGGLRIGRRHHRLSTDEARARMPTLAADRIDGAYLYFDAQADDARLTLTLARTAALDFGAVVANRVRVVGVDKDGAGRVRGARVVDEETGAEVVVAAGAVVNAAGVWVDDVTTLDRPEVPRTIRPAKGVHLTVPWDRVRSDTAVIVPVSGDRRSVFAVPWGESIYIGTTDTDYEGPVDEPICTADDVAYLLGAINRALVDELTPDDVVGAWAGVRPLVRDPARGRTVDLSRRHQVHRSPSGMVTVAGGKLTTYRAMAEDVVDEVVRVLEEHGRLSALDPAPRGCRTRRLPLRGAAGHDEVRAEADDPHLAGRYGGEARTVLAMIAHDEELGAPLVPGLPYVKAEALYAVRYEMARSLDDVLSRRTRARILARDASAAAAAEIAALIAPDLAWDDATRAAEVAAYRASVEAERAAAGLPVTPVPSVP
jgi:glycerol-3-phosphate dehydrogenase